MRESPPRPPTTWCWRCRRRARTWSFTAASSQVHIAFVNDRDCVEIEIRDEGVFNRRIPMPEFEGTQGHGIPLMIALMDEVLIQEGTKRRGGTLVRLRKCRDA